MDIVKAPLRALHHTIEELFRRAYRTDVDDEIVDDPLLSARRSDSNWST
jgi:hypothetical protein